MDKVVDLPPVESSAVWYSNVSVGEKIATPLAHSNTRSMAYTHTLRHTHTPHTHTHTHTHSHIHTHTHTHTEKERETRVHF